MRDHYNHVLKTTFHEKLLQSRNDLCISQEEMAHRLGMSSRSYVDLEHGKSGCSALTLVFYLIYLCSDSQAFLNELKEAFENDEYGKQAV